MGATVCLQKNWDWSLQVSPETLQVFEITLPQWLSANEWRFRANDWAFLWALLGQGASESQQRKCLFLLEWGLKEYLLVWYKARMLAQIPAPQFSLLGEFHLWLETPGEPVTYPWTPRQFQMVKLVANGAPSPAMLPEAWWVSAPYLRKITLVEKNPDL